MGVSKVILGEETLIDLTSDSVSSETLLEGATAHGADGEPVVGGVVVVPMYTGTKAAIEEAIAAGEIPEDAVVNITDDEETSSFQSQINEISDRLSKLIERLFPYGISLVPTLTSNTGSDGGEAFASSYHSNASINYKAYKAFDGEESVENDTTKCWHAYWDGSSTFPQWLGYKFVEPVRATKFTVLPMYASDSGGSRVKTYKYQASNNNINWVDLTEELIHANDFSKKSDEATKNIGEYLYYRIYIIDNYSTYAAAINELQFYEQL